MVRSALVLGLAVVFAGPAVGQTPKEKGLDFL